MDASLKKYLMREDVSVSDKINTFFDRVDMAGSFMPLKKLEAFVFEAPEEIQRTRDYEYLKGLYDGRWIHEELGDI